MMSWGKWAPLKLIAMVVLPPESPFLVEGNHTAHRLR